MMDFLFFFIKKKNNFLKNTNKNNNFTSFSGFQNARGMKLHSNLIFFSD